MSAGRCATIERFSLERASTPLGEMLLLTDEQGRLRALDWADFEARMHTLLRQQYRGMHIELGARTEPSESLLRVHDYFAGRLDALDTILVATGGTSFQREVWAALREIPSGETTHYGVLAARLGRPRSARAVGFANGQNPIGVVVPCHRVVGASGALTGYAGGLERKRWLLDHERKWSKHYARR